MEEFLTEEALVTCGVQAMNYKQHCDFESRTHLEPLEPLASVTHQCVFQEDCYAIMKMSLGSESGQLRLDQLKRLRLTLKGNGSSIVLQDLTGPAINAILTLQDDRRFNTGYLARIPFMDYGFNVAFLRELSYTVFISLDWADGYQVPADLQLVACCYVPRTTVEKERMAMCMNHDWMYTTSETIRIKVERGAVQKLLRHRSPPRHAPLCSVGIVISRPAVLAVPTQPLMVKGTLRLANATVHVSPLTATITDDAYYLAGGGGFGYNSLLTNIATDMIGHNLVDSTSTLTVTESTDVGSELDITILYFDILHFIRSIDVSYGRQWMRHWQMSSSNTCIISRMHTHPVESLLMRQPPLPPAPTQPQRWDDEITYEIVGWEPRVEVEVLPDQPPAPALTCGDICNQLITHELIPLIASCRSTDEPCCVSHETIPRYEFYTVCPQCKVNTSYSSQIEWWSTGTHYATCAHCRYRYTSYSDVKIYRNCTQFQYWRHSVISWLTGLTVVPT